MSYRTTNTLLSNADGHSFAYREVGKSNGGVPIIALTHLTANLDDWDPAVIDGLATKYRVIAVDNSGLGRSNGVTPSSVDEMAEGAVTFIRSLGLNQVDLFGFSLGGFIAVAIAHDYPALVRKVILAGTAPQGGVGVADVPGVFQDLVKKAGQHKKHPKNFLFFAQTQNSQQAANAFLARLAERTDDDRDTATTNATIGAQLEAIVKYGQTPRSAEYLDSIKQPALVVNGDDDVLIPTINSYDLYNGLPNAQLSIFPNSGHGAIFQYYEEFVRQALRFLAEQ